MPRIGVANPTSNPKILVDADLDTLATAPFGGHTPTGVLVRVLQHLMALTAAIWHNDRTGQAVRRSLLAYDH